MKIKLVFVLNLLALALVVVGGFLLRAERRSAAEAEVELIRLSAENEALGEAHRLLAAAATGREKLEAYFVDPRTLPVLIENLEKLASTTKISLTLTQATVTNENPDQPILRFNLEATGNFPRLSQFFGLLENSPYRLAINDLQLERVGDVSVAGASWQARASVILESYRQESR